MNIASESQRKMFFALGKEIGFSANDLKNRAKEKFKLESFTNIESSQINELIDAMQSKLKEKEHEHTFVCSKCKAQLEIVIK